MEIIDIHCHALLGADDKATDIEEAKRMLDTAYSDGIRAICFTPHFKVQSFADSDSVEAFDKQIQAYFDEINSFARENYQDLSLYLGCELLYHSESIELPISNPLRRINGGSYVLIEFYPEVSIYEMRNAVTRILRKGFVPIIAHIERYTALINRPNFAWDLREYGALLQADAKYVAKMRLGKISRFLKHMFRKSYIDVVASNSHNSQSYEHIMTKAAKRICYLYGKEMAERVLYSTPKSIIENKKLLG
ncbi:MAG: hypothetical protein IJV68_07835 [Clostridia bacterium]|nr:hypothetical protein [Clostridia bacterium]